MTNGDIKGKLGLSVICTGLAGFDSSIPSSCPRVLAIQASDLCGGLGGLGRIVYLKRVRTKSDIGGTDVTLSLLSPGTISLN